MEFDMELKKIVSSMGLVFLSGALLTGCAGDDGANGANGADAPTLSEVTAAVTKLADARKVLETNADIALAAYSDSVDTAIALKTAIATFEGDRTQANFNAAKEAWLVAREPYGQTEVYRFRNSPIDSTDYEHEDGPEGAINAWPLGEALIDYVTTGDDFGNDQIGVTAHSVGSPVPSEITTASAIADGAGTYTDTIIGSAIDINAALVANTMTADDEHDVIAGYHAIEFMLWGQDLNTNEIDAGPDGRDATAGHRPLTDFTAELNKNRRFAYMEEVVDKLIADLKDVRDAWKKGAEYRVAFTSPATQAEADSKIEEILKGMGTLSEGELAGERMQIALVNNSQEDEHSCFSDNTHRDIWLNAEGVSNSWYGSYEGYDSTLDGVDDNKDSAVSGYGLNQYVKAYGNATNANDLENMLASTKIGYEAIDDLARAGTPFDLQIKSPTASDADKVRGTISALSDQSAAIQAIATDLGLGGVVDPDASGCDTTDPTSDC